MIPFEYDLQAPDEESAYVEAEDRTENALGNRKLGFVRGNIEQLH